MTQRREPRARSTRGDRGVRPWDVLARPGFRRLFVADVVSNVGDWVGLLAVMALAARVASRAELGVAAVMSSRMIPGLVLGPLSGVLADRWDRRRIMLGVNGGRALILVPLPFANSLWLLCLAAFFLEALADLWGPARHASIPHLVDRHQLPAANGLSLVAVYGTLPLGSGLFAGLVAVGGHVSVVGVELPRETIAIWFDVLTFALAVLVLRQVRLPGSTRVLAQRASLSETVRELREGVGFVIRHRVVRVIVVCLPLGVGLGSSLVPLAPVLSERVLRVRSAGFGLLIAALGTGAALSIVAATMLGTRLSNRVLFSGALMGSGIAVVAVAAWATLPSALLAIAAVGLGAGLAYSAGFSVVQEVVPDDLRGRVFGVLNQALRLALLGSFTLWPIVAAVLDDFLGGKRIEIGGISHTVDGTRVALWLAGAAIVAVALFAARSVRRANNFADAHHTSPSVKH